ncbi:MAG: hypothetical protein IT436_11730 [Phycisphaerales bacterium]|nr:hypothetical protein [Phycisphaerales bacterium]
MSRSRDVNRSSENPRTSALARWFGRARDRFTGTGRLAREAGRAGGFVEPLEKRELLFSMTITPSDVDGTGIGTVEATFAYAVPYLAPTVDVGTADPTSQQEDFQDENAGNVVNGRLFGGSFFRVFHNITPAGDVQIIENVPPGDGDKYMQVRQDTGGEFWNLRFAVSDQAPNTFLAARSVSFNIEPRLVGGTGLVPDNFLVELVFQDQVIRTFTGDTLRAVNPSPRGIGNYTFTGTTANPAFDSVRITALVGGNDAYKVDDITAVYPPGNFAGIVGSRIFAATVVFSGPVGASAQILDLYGNEMVQTIAAGTPPSGAQVTLIDPDDDGRPNFNDGIGRIVLRGTDSRSAITVWGGTISPTTTPPPEDTAPGIRFDGRLWDGAFLATMSQNLQGQYDAFESSGFGYVFDGIQRRALGLPPGPGSLVLGSPFVRSAATPGEYNPGGLPVTRDEFGRLIPVSNIVTDGFTRADQGVFVLDGASMGSVYINGIVHGSSNFSGALDRFVAGYLVGSIGVAGDLGALVVGSDAGQWVIDPGSTIAVPDAIKTKGQLVVGRAVGQIEIAGRSLLDVTVQGDLSTPQTRPPRNVFNYFEQEFAYGLLVEAGIPATVLQTLINNDFGASLNNRGFRASDQALAFGDGFLRNDTIMSAEWVGTTASGVQISGDVGYGDPINTGEDGADVYGFATDGTQPIVVQFDAGQTGNLLVRVMDVNGRTVMANQFGRLLQNSQFITFNPDAPGIYYLVLSIPGGTDGDLRTGFAYSMTLTGLAPVTLGSYRTGAANARSDVSADFTNTISVLAGNVGTIRVGTAYVNGAGAETDPSVAVNLAASDTDVDDVLAFRGGTFSIPGNLYNITTGSDIQAGLGRPVNIFVGGSLGSLITGQSPVVGIGANEGDIRFFNLTVGGSVALLDVKGGLSIEQDGTAINWNPAPPDNINIVTGASGGRGDIGMFRVGFHVMGDAMNVTTSPGSVIGGFLISQDVVSDPGDFFTGVYGGFDGVTFNTGAGSDIRFISFPKLDLRTGVREEYPLIGGQTLELIDDGGGTVRIRPINVPAGGFLGTVRAFPIDGSEGVAIGDITVDLSNGAGGIGASLEIETIGPAGSSDIVTIGRIVITGSGTNSGVTVRGNVQTDVYSILQTGGGALSFIRNQTPLGDIVAIDVAGLTTLDITTGDLGRTQVPAWGPRRIGPFLGIQQGPNGTAGGALGIPTDVIDADWGGGLYRRTNELTTAAGQGFLEDMGSPFDPYLNGLVVRAGNIDDVNVGGAIGDVILQNGDIVRLTANFDRATPSGRFDGIVGSIYANNLFRIAIGDGLLQRDTSPFASTGLFAVNDIVQVLGQDIPGQYISSVITAGNNVIDIGTGQFNGVDTIDLQGGGDYIDAYISCENLDGFWVGIPYGDDGAIAGDINRITGEDADMFRTQVAANNIDTILLTDGFFDASSVRAVGGTVNRIEAAGFRNSTLAGTELEFRTSELLVGRDLGILTTTGKTGDIADLVIDVVGSVTGEISARTIVRAKIDVDINLTLLSVTDSVRASAVTAGQLTKFTAGRNVQSSSFRVSGALPDFSAGNAIVNTSINVTGPFGRIIKISAPNQISGSISSSGPIDSITSTAGDIVATITTTGPSGNVKLLSAGRDLDIETDISGSLDTLTAGRHIGNRADPSVILVRGNLLSATMGGQLYSDLRVGQAITGTVTIGPVSRLPGADLGGSGSIVAFGAINAVAVTGDFGGDIISYSGGIKGITITGGSFLPGRTIAAYDGSIDGIVISGGNLYGNIHADYVLLSVQVVASADGVFGDIGINPFLTGSTPYDAFRNQLPIGVVAAAPIQGPRISAGQNIGTIATTNGSMFEATILAGRAIGVIEIRGDVRNDTQTPGRGTLIAAGDSIAGIGVYGDFFNAHILSGVVSLGADGRAGGVGANADTIKSATIGGVGVVGNAADLVIEAGMLAGVDGLYATADDVTAMGLSSITSISLGASVVLVSAFSDALDPSIIADARITKGGLTAANEDPQVIGGGGPFGTPIPGSLAFDVGGDKGTIFFSGPGEAFFDAANKRVVLLNTTLASALTVTSDLFTLTDFDIATNDDASIGTLYIGASLLGDSDVTVDGSVGSFTVGNVSGTGSFRLGGDLGSFMSGGFSGGLLSAKIAGGVVVSGDFGAASPATRGEARFSFLTASGITITGVNRGAVNVDRDLSGFASGTMDNATLRSGGTIATITAGALNRTWISARDAIGTVSIAGDMFDSSIMSGGDLGADGEFGGTGLNADRATTGTIGSVAVGGNFGESDVVAGLLRGADGFFGSSDDNVADGRSAIGSVTIGGTQVGSTRQSESYRISSTGTIDAVSIGGAPGQASANFAIDRLNLMPLAVQVKDIQVTEDSRIYTARIFFNQPVDASTLARAISVAEVRGRSDVSIRLINGIDYTLTYDAANNAAVLVFSRTITGRDLPQIASRPGPGVYRFQILQDVLRGQLVNQRLDGDGDGIAETGDNFSKDDIVGDPGDKLFTERDTVTRVGAAPATIDMYGPFSLDFVLDNNQQADGLAEPNQTFTIRGSIGDHPDNDINNFRFAGDLDLYTITLQAGQIFRVGANTGPALRAEVRLIAPDGTILPDVAASNDTLPLPVQRPADTAQTVGHTYLVKTTGTYTLLVGNAYTPVQLFDELGAGRLTDAQFNQLLNDEGFAYRASGFVPNLDPVPGGLGDYAFTVNIFDDGDTGFSATTDAGDGSAVVNAPASSSFSGGDQVLGTADDLKQISIGAFTFTYNPGADGLVGTVDDFVTGSTPQITSFHNGDGRLISIINGSIGPANASGVPTTVFPDADVYHLNNRTSIAPGTRMRITVRLTEFGTDLGSRNQLVFGSDQFNLDNFRGAVQFGLFDTSASTRIDDGSLVFSPTNFSPNGGTPNTTIATDGTTTYGYDGNGDFFIDFVTPGRPGPDGKTGTADDQASKYAIYLQGVYSGDYQIQVDTTAPTTTRITPRRQNILLETRGGTIDWLEKGGLTTRLSAFSTSPIGFSGSVASGQTVDQYVLTSVRNALQSIFNAAGLDVRFSTDPRDFEFQDFSTVYLSSTVDPVSLLFNAYADPRVALTSTVTLGAYQFATLGDGFSRLQPFGFAEHSDALNADVRDEAVVFIPSMALLGYTPAQSDIDLLASSTTAAIARRVGELMGARITSNNSPTSSIRDPLAADSVTGPTVVGSSFTLPAINRLLSDPFDSIDSSDFFLGAQSTRTVLSRVAGK